MLFMIQNLKFTVVIKGDYAIFTFLMNELDEGLSKYSRENEEMLFDSKGKIWVNVFLDFKFLRNQYMETAAATTAVPATASAEADPSQYCLVYQLPAVDP